MRQRISRIGWMAGIATATLLMAVPLSANAQHESHGVVLEFSGEAGDLLLSRDGIVYTISTGEELFPGDILRARQDSTATLSYNNCLVRLVGGEEIVMDDQVCPSTVIAEPTLAERASTGSALSDAPAVITGAGAPLIVGGVVLSAGGIAAAATDDGTGTSSAATQAAGSNPASPNSPG